MRPQLVGITSDNEAAAALAARMAPAASQRGLRVLAATEVRRASRVLRAEPAHLVFGSATVLLELVRATILKLGEVRAVALVSVDDLDAAGVAALETVMAEIPKDAARVIVASAVTPGVDQLVERYARRARRMQPVAAEVSPPVSLSYVAVSELSRPAMLRRVLDALDPESAFIVVRSAASRAAVSEQLQSLGYGTESSAIRVGDTPSGDARLVVLYDLPPHEEELRRLVAQHSASRVVALVTPRQIPALRRLAGGTVTPLSLPDAAVRARGREESLRDELREALAAGQFARELITLEPLLGDYDGVEVAAAALKLLEAERAKATSAPGTAKTPAALTRLYLNVGSMDNVRPGDLVGAIANEAGISRDEMGKVDVRERHSTVEVATPVANSVVSKLTGISIRGRRVIARVDEERERPRRDDARLGTRDRARGQRDFRDREKRPRDRSRPDET